MDQSQKLPLNNPKMRKRFFTNLPLEITIDILARLTPRTIISCKCVCKSWLELLDSNGFLKSRLSKSVPGIVIHRTDGRSKYDFIEFEDGEDLEHHNLHYYRLTKFDFPCRAELKGSANGLLFLRKCCSKSEAHYVCNPFTRDYVEVPCPKDSFGSYSPEDKLPEIEAIEDALVYTYPQSVTYGFGASKVTGQYKVLRIFHDSVIAHEYEHEEPSRIIPESQCHVYTLGTGSWRLVESGAPLEYSVRASCVFLNGNLHWLVTDSDSKMWISCFDLETERFSTFRTPPLYRDEHEVIAGLCALGDCLCLCGHSNASKTVVWLMKEYGVEKWAKKYMTNEIGYNRLHFNYIELVYPIKVFKDGDIMMLKEDHQLIYYSKKTRRAHEIGIFRANFVHTVLFTPSLLSLKCLKMENVISF